MEDIILVTVDCWRNDAPDVMPQFEAMTESWNAGSVVCAAAATNGVFPAIFASQFYPDLYQRDGTIPDDAESIATVLSEQGYSTGGFVASNPFVGKWSEHFDEWWNDGMSASGTEDEWNYTLFDNLKHLASLSPRTPAEDVLSRADDWWEQTASPRFLWVHLMEPHGPYFPGFDLGREVGLFRSYVSVTGSSKLGQDRPAWMDEQLKRLHYQCNKRLDRVLTPWLKSHEDATIVLTGDHGEEFDHGVLKHARLYDETVRVPLASNELFGSLGDKQLVRQLDLAPSLLAELGIGVPSSWEGTESTGEMQPQEMINSSPELERDWVGIRSESWKIIRPYDWDDGPQQSEAYHVESDPDEQESKPESAAPKELRDQLDEFVKRPVIAQELSSTDELQTGFNSEVEGRLKELGYIE